MVTMNHTWWNMQGLRSRLRHQLVDQPREQIECVIKTLINLQILGQITNADLNNWWNNDNFFSQTSFLHYPEIVVVLSWHQFHIYKITTRSPDVGERAPGHDRVIASPRAVRVELARNNAKAGQESRRLQEKNMNFVKDQKNRKHKRKVYVSLCSIHN